MLQAPVLTNDRERVAALDRLAILDTPAEERFDRVVRLLKRIFDMPMAYISLIDANRQWFKAACGIDAKETARDISFCGHAIAQDDTFIVSDAREDSRFADNPLVTGEPFLRFYAGQPLWSSDKFKVGTLCIADRRPRQFDESSRAILRELAKIVERELSLIETVQLQKETIELREKAAEANREKAEYLAGMVASQKLLLDEITQAARYVRSLLPVPLDAPIRTRWQYVPSSKLGGDCFGYDWLDDEHFAAYLLDVSGHGVGAALLSVSVLNALRSRALPDVDFRDPAAVLSRLNDSFPMDRQDGKYFTMWYGVFHRPSRRLRFSNAGHPPALLLDGRNRCEQLCELGADNFAIGMLDGIEYTSQEMDVPSSGRLLVFSDGVYEIDRPDGSMMQRADLTHFLSNGGRCATPTEILKFVQTQANAESFKDDFSLLEMQFD